MRMMLPSEFARVMTILLSQFAMCSDKMAGQYFSASTSSLPGCHTGGGERGIPPLAQFPQCYKSINAR